MDDFDFEYYVNRYADLARFDKNRAYAHWVHHGQREGRVAKPLHMLIVIAMHTTSAVKQAVTENNVRKLEAEHESFVITWVGVDSIGCESYRPNNLRNVLYVENDPIGLDTAKWIYFLTTHDQSKYNYVTLINDSVVFLRTIPDYYEYVSRTPPTSLTMLSMLCSTQIKPHATSFLRTFPKALLPRYIEYSAIRYPP